MAQPPTETGVLVSTALKELRQSVMQLSQTQFARKVSLTVVSIHKYESGRYVPKLGILWRFAGIATRAGRTDLSRVFLLPISEALDTPVFALERAFCANEVAA